MNSLKQLIFNNSTNIGYADNHIFWNVDNIFHSKEGSLFFRSLSLLQDIILELDFTYE